MMTTLAPGDAMWPAGQPRSPLHHLEEQWQDNPADGKLQQPQATKGQAGDTRLTVLVQPASPSWELHHWIQKLSSDEFFVTVW